MAYTVLLGYSHAHEYTEPSYPRGLLGFIVRKFEQIAHVFNNARIQQRTVWVFQILTPLDKPTPPRCLYAPSCAKITISAQAERVILWIILSTPHCQGTGGFMRRETHE